MEAVLDAWDLQEERQEVFSLWWVEGSGQEWDGGFKSQSQKVAEGTGLG